jgi:hypothetical protein
MLRVIIVSIVDYLAGQSQTHIFFESQSELFDTVVSVLGRLKSNDAGALGCTWRLKSTSTRKLPIRFKITSPYMQNAG